MIETESLFKVRFSDAPWYKRIKETYVLLLGAGGIGSWLGFNLSRAGANFTVFDMDIVEAHNLAGQCFNNQHISMSKTEALVQVCSTFSGGENSILREGKYTEDSYTNDVVFAAFDNMEARKLAYRKWKSAVLELSEEDRKNWFFCDGRLLAEDYQVYAVTGDSLKKMELYEKTLFDDADIPDVMCTLKSTTHCSEAIASEMFMVYSNWSSNRAWGVDVREVPFSIVKSVQEYRYDITYVEGINVIRKSLITLKEEENV